MAEAKDKLFKKGYTEFDERLDRELEEEKLARRKQLLLTAPDIKLLNQWSETGAESPDLSERLNKAGLYYIRSRDEDSVEKFSEILRKTLANHPSIRKDLLKQMGLLGCLAFKKNMPLLGKICAETLLCDLCFLDEEPEAVAEGWLFLKNVTDTAARSHNDAAFGDIVTSLYDSWKETRISVSPGLISMVSNLLFVSADRRLCNTLITVCRLCRSVLRHVSVDLPTRQWMVMEWSSIAAQIAQRGWGQECNLLLRHLCLFLGSVREITLTKKVLADVSVHMQMQCQCDGFETAFRLYCPCYVFAMEALQWVIRRCRRIAVKEKELEWEAGQQPFGMMDRLDYKMKILSEKEDMLDFLRFLLRNGRDMAAGCARLVMKDECGIYLSWHQEWITMHTNKGKRGKSIKIFVQMVAEYWYNTQPSRSKKQWENMSELMNPSVLTGEHRKLLEQVV